MVATGFPSQDTPQEPADPDEAALCEHLGVVDRRRDVGSRFFVADGVAVDGQLFAVGYLDPDQRPYVVSFTPEGEILWETLLEDTVGIATSAGASADGRVLVAGMRAPESGTPTGKLWAVDGEGTAVEIAEHEGRAWHDLAIAPDGTAALAGAAVDGERVAAALMIRSPDGAELEGEVQSSDDDGLRWVAMTSDLTFTDYLQAVSNSTGEQVSGPQAEVRGELHINSDALFVGGTLCEACPSEEQRWFVDAWDLDGPIATHQWRVEEPGRSYRLTLAHGEPLTIVREETGNFNDPYGLFAVRFEAGRRAWDQFLFVDASGFANATVWEDSEEPFLHVVLAAHHDTWPFSPIVSVCI